MAGPLLFDRVRETTATTGTGTFTLAGAVTGYRSFITVGDANTCYYCCAHPSDGSWEVGIGTYQFSGTLLARTTVLASSTGAKVSFAAGAKDVFLTSPAQILNCPRGYIDGLIIAYVGATSFSVAVGSCVDSTNALWMQLAASITKTTSSWAVGSSQGGLDTGAIAANTWYHVYLIMRSDTGVVDVLFSTSVTSPTMPTNYDFKRIIGSVLTDAISQFPPFTSTGDEFLWNTPLLDVNVTNLSTTSVSYTLSTPSGVKTVAIITGRMEHATAGTVVYVRSIDQLDITPNATYSTSQNSINGSPRGTQFFALVRTNTSSQLGAASSASNTTLNITTRGYYHPRGKDI